MAFSEFEQARYTKLLNQFIDDIRPPASIREKLDIRGKLAGQSIEIQEIRSRQNAPSQALTIPVARIRYIKTQKCWRLYWMRISEKWEKYDKYEHLEFALHAIRQDVKGCFWE